MAATQPSKKEGKDYICAKPHEPVKCYECGKTYSNRECLEHHLAQKHGIS